MSWRLFPITFAMALLCAAADPDPRGIFLAAAPGAAGSPAARFKIELNRNGQVGPVASNYRFQTGDRFRFLFELSQPSYVYVVNRSVEGDPDQMGALLGTRGINVVNQTAGGAAPSMQLLWPARGANARLAAGQAQSVPGPTQYFEFDAKPGLEKIAMVVSPYPIDPSKYFVGLAGAPQPSASNREDTNEDVLAQLQDLRSMENNTATDPGNNRGICVGDCSQYSAPRNPAQPFILTVDLLHAAR